MKALIRGPNETITEEMHVSIDWETGMPLTSQDWFGGAYTLIQDYHPAPLPSEDMTNVDMEIAKLKAKLATLEGKN